MNLQHLRYAVEVERTGSITGAAQRLYMSQPHLSRAIRELETEMQFPIFERTPKGMVPTKEGREFLFFAKDVLGRMDDIGRLKARMRGRKQICSIEAPGGACLAEGFLAFAAAGRKLAEEYHYRELDSRNVVSDAASGKCRFGIVRCQEVYEFYFQNLFREKNLTVREIWQYGMKVWVGGDHPAAGREDLTYLDLGSYPEIRCGAEAFGGENEPEGPSDQKLFVSGRAEAFALLNRIPGSYLWEPPMPKERAAQWSIRPLTCRRPGNAYRDYLICRREFGESEEARRLFACLREAAEEAL